MVAGAMALGAVIAPSFAFAQTSTSTPESQAGMSVHSKTFTRKEMVARAGRGVSGTVVSVNGSSIVITDRKNTTYTVDATNAKFGGMGVENSLTLAGILVGDKINARGTISGTTVSALSISDMSYVARTVFSGKVTAINGTSITLSQKNNTSLTVNVGSATVTKGFGKNAKTIAIGDIVVGDRLTAIGTLSGTTVTATKAEDMVGGMLGRSGARMQKKS